VAAEPKSFTGQYLKPLLERASVQPMGRSDRKDKPQPARSKTRSSRAKSRGADEDQPDLIAAK
jgi:hypothetical protein